MKSLPAQPDPSSGSLISRRTPRRRFESEAPTAISGVTWEAERDLTAREWAVIGKRLGKIGRASQWWIGDWLRYGTQKWGEKYVQAARITGYDVASLRNMAWVASQFNPSLRNDDLTWSHHALLAPLALDQKEYWLSEAARKRLSVADLRIELRALRSAKRGGWSKRNAASATSDSIVCPKCGHKVQLAE